MFAEEIERARQDLEAGRLAEAAAGLAELVRLSPGDVRLRQRLTDVYLRMGYRAHAVAELQHLAGRYAAEGELFKAIAVCKQIAAIDSRRQQTLQAVCDLYALQREGSATALLPAEMAGAVAAQEPAGDLVEFLREDALPPRSQEEPAVLPTPSATEIDLGPLPASPLFSALDKQAFAALVRVVDLRWIHAGETIVEEGQRGESMFIVVQGGVDVVHGGKRVATIAEGGFFGEMALVTDAPRLATVRAARDGLLFEIGRSKLTGLLVSHAAVGRVIDAFHRDRLLSNVLRASPLFRPLSAHEQEQIGGRFVRHSLEPRSVVLRQGETGRGLCVILRGKCDAFHETPQGEVPLTQMREGDVFGEISLLLDGPCTATVRAAGACEVLELPREDFHALVLPNPDVRAMIEKLAGERLSRTADLMEREPRLMRDYLV